MVQISKQIQNLLITQIIILILYTIVKNNHFLKNTFSQFEIINIFPIFVNNQ